MRVIHLIKELNIAFTTLQQYGNFVDFIFTDVNQIIPEDIYFKVVNVHNDKEIQKELLQEKKELVDPLIAFVSGENYRFYGKVRWYYNHQTSGEYGFLEVKGLPDIHFAGKVFLYKDPKNLTPDTDVVVTLNKNEVNNRKSNIRALAVNNLDDEKDINFLLFYLINNFANIEVKKASTLISQIRIHSENLTEDEIKEIELFLSDKIKLEDLSIEKLKQIPSLTRACRTNLEIFGQNLTIINSSKIFDIWSNVEGLTIEFQFIRNHLKVAADDCLKDAVVKDAEDFTFKNAITTSSFKKAKYLLGRLSNKQQKDILDELFSEASQLDDFKDYFYIVALLELYSFCDINADLKNASKKYQLKLWEDDFTEEFPFDEVYEKLLNFKNQYYAAHRNELETVTDYEQYLTRIKGRDLINILAKSHFISDVITTDDQFKTVLFLIIHIPIDYKRQYINNLFNKLSEYFKLQFFVLDYVDIIDFNAAVIYTGLLSSDKQKFFFKKIIRLIDDNKIDISLEDLNRITTIDYEINDYAKEIDGKGLDFTLSVILKVINDLKNNETTSRTSIFDLVAKQIKTPSDLLVISGFFESCSGKTIVKESTPITLANGQKERSYIKIKNEKFLPRFSTFCDGRKAINKITNQAALCRTSGYEFWWCENSQCYEVCRKQNNSSNWRNYTLEDVLRILKIPYDEIQYEILLNVINRVNRFLEHLSCRSCQSILKPKNKSNYAFYGVSLFSCNNTNCEEVSREIYLSHCLNGQCEDIIDSRDSVKCITQDYSQDCGWYICNNCNACCSSDKLAVRAGNLEMLGQDYKCHMVGHRDRGIICCSGCGNEMIESGKSTELYSKQLDWFISQKLEHPNIIRFGTREKDNKWWFIWARGNYSHSEYRKQLQGLYSGGFSIPNYNDQEKDSQLIAEPFAEQKSNKVFVCVKCDLLFDLESKDEFDFPRKKAVQKFHLNVFPHSNL